MFSELLPSRLLNNILHVTKGNNVFRIELILQIHIVSVFVEDLREEHRHKRHGDVASRLIIEFIKCVIEFLSHGECWNTDSCHMIARFFFYCSMNTDKGRVHMKKCDIVRPIERVETYIMRKIVVTEHRVKLRERGL